MAESVQIHPSWIKIVSKFNPGIGLAAIKQFILNEKNNDKTVYPPASLIFNAFNQTPFSELKVVILGQDPYHGKGEAHGLCFSVPIGIKIPPSLRNIFKELNDDLGCGIPSSGDLSQWAKQGVLLLNAILTVNEKEPASHKAAGWEHFTDYIIQTISETKENVVFVLWGGFAKSKKIFIDTNKHLILEAPHPAAEVYAGGKAGFFGSKPFSQTNNYLIGNGLSEINWCLS